jgi:hypothetical protein
MLNHLFSFAGACGLIIVLTGIIPMLPAYAAGTNCTGTCKVDTDTGGCDTSQPSGAGTCAEVGTGCGCKTGSKGGAGTCTCS